MHKRGIIVSNEQKQDYIAKHRKIRQKLSELTNKSGHACIVVSQLACKVGMDPRTVRSHLRIMEVDMLGVFMDAYEKQFCTKEGVYQLADTLGQAKYPVPKLELSTKY